jgi:hypothetical protein
LGYGTSSAGELNAFGRFVSFAFFPLFLLLYMLPTYEAWKNQHPNLAAIALVNLFLGWTLLGWVVAIVWAFRKAEPVTVSFRSSAEGVRNFAETQPARQTKTCAFCAEEILVAAIKCKHCGSDVRA